MGADRVPAGGRRVRNRHGDGALEARGGALRCLGAAGRRVEGCVA